ncbi:MAG: hypothetical protein KC933_30675 [Myxococcales bacterium]|nr:hypothetical protein [Myxococcales bacterium]MCB9650718.1 hypothetical protein [Deltaproteobacteria bacterium]
MRPTWSRLLGLLVLTCSNNACLLPADDVVVVSPVGASPPQVDLRSLDPREGRLEISRTDCRTFEVKVGAIWDEDDETLLFRWVANNDLHSTRQLRQERIGAPLGERRPSTALVDPQRFFPEEWDLTDPSRPDSAPTALGILSLFITDAPEWQDPMPDLSGNQAQDLSLIVSPETDGGESPYSVVEVRWGVLIGQDFPRCEY